MMMKSKNKLLLAVLAAPLMCSLSIPVQAEDAVKKSPKGDVTKAVGSQSEDTMPKIKMVKTRKHKPREIKMNGDAVSQLEKSESGRFCANIRDSAREKRYALKTKELNELQSKVEARISALEEKRVEFENWTKKRDEFLKRAEGTLVEIYSKMRPDAAAGRLEILSQNLAAAILMKLSARKAGVILNEMKAENAAKITQVIASSGNVGDRS